MNKGFRLIYFLLWPCFVVLTASLMSAQSAPNKSPVLTTEKVIELLQLKFTPEVIIGILVKNTSSFDLSPSALASLEAAGATPSLENAMLQANRRSYKLLPGPKQSLVNDPAATTAPVPAPKGNNIQEVKPPDVKAADTRPAAVQAPLPPTPVISSLSYPPHTIERFRLAAAFKTNPGDSLYPKPHEAESCATKNSSWRAFNSRVLTELQWDPSGKTETLQLDRSGDYCFALHDVNDFVYSYSGSLKFQDLTGDPMALLKAAVTSVKDFGTGGAAAPPPEPGAKKIVCSLTNLDDAAQKAAVLNQAITAMLPAKDSSGAFVNRPLSDSETKWSVVPAAFSAFESSIGGLVTQMSAATKDPTALGCTDDVLAQAEFMVIETYGNQVRPQFINLNAVANGPHIAYFARPIKLTGDNTLTVTARSSVAQVPAITNTFIFPHAYAVLNSSVGFLLTELPARAYSSRTSPDPANPTTGTKNVLAIDYGSGIRPAVVVLLNANPPATNFRNFGLGISAGPVFDILNGKADTSKFGFFTGLSLRFTPHLYITPGFHFGQFADFPQGFNHPGQVIPPNTGTPTPNLRYSARFAFAITWKSKDLGDTTGTAQQASQQPKPAATAPAAAPGANSKPKS